MGMKKCLVCIVTLALLSMMVVVPGAALAESGNAAANAVCTLIELVLGNNFENHEVSVDGNMIVVNLWQSGLALEVAMLKASGDDENNSDWVTLKDNVISMSDSILGLMATAEVDDMYLNINIKNDINTENVLLSLLNSYVIFDAMAD